MKKYSFAKTLAFTLIGWILCMILLVATCNHSIKKQERQTGKTLLQELGEEAKKAKDEFNKGFKPDSIKPIRKDSI